MNFFSPAEVASNYIATGKSKVNLPAIKMLLLGIMAGAFIAFGGIGATTVAVSIPLASVGKFIGACVFPGGLTMVLIAGSELFTGNCLLVIPLLEREIRLRQMLKSWIIVYIGNLIGALLVSAGVAYSHELGLFHNDLAVAVINTAITKCSMTFSDAFLRGVMCNFLVCIVAGKIMGLFFPIMIFVLCGFEHSIANMFYIGAGLFDKTVPVFAEAAAAAGVDMTNLTWGNFFLKNLLPVSLGNLVGGAFVGWVYWFCYLRKGKKQG